MNKNYLPDLPPRSKSSLRGSGGGLSSPLPGFPRRWGGKYRLFPPLEDRSFSTPRPASWMKNLGYNFL